MLMVPREPGQLFGCQVKKWPENGEIDLMEHLNFDRKVYHSVHSEYTVNMDKDDALRNGGTTEINPDLWNVYGSILG